MPKLGPPKNKRPTFPQCCDTCEYLDKVESYPHEDIGIQGPSTISYVCRRDGEDYSEEWTVCDGHRYEKVYRRKKAKNR